jgi:hypothetical protein
MSTRTSTVYKYVKEHYPITKELRGVRKHPWARGIKERLNEEASVSVKFRTGPKWDALPRELNHSVTFHSSSYQR